MKRKYIISIALVAIIALIAYKLSANKKQIDANNTPEKKVAVKILKKKKMDTEDFELYRREVEILKI